MKTMARRPNAVAGFTLIEIMVAMLVLAIGLLGLAGMQANGTRQNLTALNRSQATMLAYDMAERIRTNAAGRGTGNYDAIDTNAVGAPATDCLSAVVTCNGTDMAAYDAAEWKIAVEALLPSGRAFVAGNGAAAGSPMTITVMWDEDRTGATGTACGPDSSVDLKCYTYTFVP